MHTLDLSGETLKLDYPCSWIYKVIGSSQEALRRAIDEILGDRDHTVSVSNYSTTGKYVCLNVELEVVDEEDRTNIFEVLRRHPSTQIIL